MKNKTPKTLLSTNSLRKGRLNPQRGERSLRMTGKSLARHVLKRLLLGKETRFQTAPQLAQLWELLCEMWLLLTSCWEECPWWGGVFQAHTVEGRWVLMKLEWQMASAQVAWFRLTSPGYAEFFPIFHSYIIPSPSQGGDKAGCLQGCAQNPQASHLVPRPQTWGGEFLPAAERTRSCQSSKGNETKSLACEAVLVLPQASQSVVLVEVLVPHWASGTLTDSGLSPNICCY